METYDWKHLFSKIAKLRNPLFSRHGITRNCSTNTLVLECRGIFFIFFFFGFEFQSVCAIPWILNGNFLSNDDDDDNDDGDDDNNDGKDNHKDDHEKDNRAEEDYNQDNQEKDKPFI